MDLGVPPIPFAKNADGAPLFERWCREKLTNKAGLPANISAAGRVHRSFGAKSRRLRMTSVGESGTDGTFPGFSAGDRRAEATGG